MASNESTNKTEIRSSGKEYPSSKINIGELIFRQIERVNQNFSSQNPFFFTSVMALEDLLNAYCETDEEYKADIKDMNKLIDTEISRLKSKGHIILGGQTDIFAFVSASEKYKALMKMIDRAGLLPEKEIIYDQEEAEDPKDVKEPEPEYEPETIQEPEGGDNAASI